MFESRQSERKRCLLKAVVVFDDGARTVECIVRNISDTGAKIEVSRSILVPPVFDIDIAQKGRIYSARLVWRNEDFLGLEFVEANKASDSDEARLRHATAENRKLKAAVAHLQDRLSALGQDVRM